jgi:hypothetical protein
MEVVTCRGLFRWPVHKDGHIGRFRFGPSAINTATIRGKDELTAAVVKEHVANGAVSEFGFAKIGHERGSRWKRGGAALGSAAPHMEGR